VARTAVVAGTASATSNAVHSRQQQAQQTAGARADEQQHLAQLQQQVADLQSQQLQAELGPSQVATTPTSDITVQLGQLAQFLESGILAQDEFNVAKAKLLGL